MENLDDLIEYDGELWTPQQLCDYAICLLKRADKILIGITERCDIRIAKLKAADYSSLSPEDKLLLDAQLAHEAKMENKNGYSTTISLSN